MPQGRKARTMTIKEMCKKVETYNEVANIAGVDKIELRFSKGYGMSEPVKDYKSFKKYIKDEYIDCFADAILNCSEWEMDEDREIEATDKWNYTHKDICGFCLKVIW